uniref:Calmodulin-binding transcription activator 5 n=1 Tax=Ascaris lumbricoides TaxID=6252 RepID=A0A0M3IW84_ASCLU
MSNVTTAVELSIGDAGDGSKKQKDYRDEVLAIYRRLKQLRKEQKDLKAILRAYFRAVARRKAQEEADNKRRNQAALRIQAYFRAVARRKAQEEADNKRRNQAALRIQVFEILLCDKAISFLSTTHRGQLFSFFENSFSTSLACLAKDFELGC